MPTFTGTSGNDFITPNVLSAGVIAIGGARPSALNDTLDGGLGNDFLQGGGGADLVLGGDGDDSVIWHLGDGSDIIDGGVGRLDNVIFDTSGVADGVTVGALETHATIAHDGAALLNLDNVEEAFIYTWDGADRIVLNDLSATDLRNLTVDLQGFSGLADGQADTVVMNGAATTDVLVVVKYGDGTGLEVTNRVAGVVEKTNIMRTDATDNVIFNLGGGNDSFWMGGPNGLAHFVINGDAGADALAGSLGQETINGGLDNDTIEGRGGSDVIDGGAGNDVLKWQFTGGGQLDRTSLIGGSDTDTLQLESVASFSTTWSFTNILSNGPTTLVVNGGGSLNFAGIENVELLGGTAGSGERILIGDNFSVKSYDITLRNPANDFVSFGSGGNIVGTSSIAAGVSITGFSSSVRVHGAQAKDVIEVQGGGFGDVIDMTGLRFVPFGLTVRGDFGNDTIIGPKGTALSLVKPQLLGDHGDDTIVGGTGGELIDGGQGSDTLFSSGLGTTFKFRSSDLGVDTVHSFRAHSFGGPADLMHMRDVFFGQETFDSAKQKGLIEDTGSNVVISVDGHTVAVLSNINLDQLSSADFLM